MAVLAAVQRSAASLESHGVNVKVLVHTGENHETQAIIQTSRDYLIVYSITMSTQEDDVLYKFDTSLARTLQRRRSFASTGEAEFITPCSIRYKKMIKVDSGVSRYVTLA
jgi:hypothetical protein